MPVRFDTSEVDEIAVLLLRGADVAPAETRKVVTRGAFNIKKDAARRISGHPHLRRLPYAINYDTGQTRTGAWAEIGPDHGRPQGPLGNLPEYGSINNAPTPYMRPAADAEIPKFDQAMEALAVKGIGF